MSFIQFESSREKEAKRDAVRQAREKILADAKEKYYKREAAAERAKQRGDDKWMLPSVDQKISSDNKSKKKKKEKKSKKSKKKRKRSTSPSSSNSSNDEKVEWVEKFTGVPSSTAPSTIVSGPIQRDEWMTLPGSFLTLSREKKSKNTEDTKKNTILDKLGQNSRELNPFWKDGGTGLPKEKSSTENKSVSSTMSAEWLRRSLQRAKEQAQEEGKTLEEVASERWGSLDTIETMIDEADKNSVGKNHDRYNRNMDSRKYRRDRSRSRSRSRERSRGRSRNYRPDYETSSKKYSFKKPTDNDEPSSNYATKSSTFQRKNWRKPEANDRVSRENEEKNKALAAYSRQKRSKSKSPTPQDEEVASIPTKILTDDELNKLGAKIVKAEIMGDTELAEKLKKQIENAHEARKVNPKAQQSREEERVILTTTNSRGMTRNLEPRSQYEEPQGGRRRSKKTDTHAGGERVRYFADDDKYSLQDIFQREKGQSVDDDDAMFVKMASKSMDMDELFEERITRGESDAKLDLRDKMRAIKQHKKMAKSLDNCRLCFDSQEMQKHLIVAMASKVYLSLPSHVSLTVGHCILASIHHVPCQTQLDEDVWAEMKEFKQALTKMCMDNNELPVFFEVFMGQHRYPHMQLECVPLPEENGSMAPMYFKKALLECEMEWSTNKKVVDLKEKDVRQAIPIGLSYFAVNFGTHGGFAHVIEDEQLFPRNFAQEIIGGMLDLDANMWRKPRRQNFNEQKEKVIAFAEKWKKYDFTCSS